MTTHNYAPGERTYEAIQLWLDNENASVVRATNLWDAMTDNMRMAWAVAERDAQRDLLDALTALTNYVDSKGDEGAGLVRLSRAALAKATGQ